jgi:GSH-dependent disulfide-bond oxidoreductase
MLYCMPLRSKEYTAMSDSNEYVPPKVWKWNPDANQAFSNINRPTAGAQLEKDLPVGEHPLQLYSLGTPNGVKVTIMLEELLAAGHTGAEYDAWLINIGDGSQFGSGFVSANPNSKIPAMVDHSMNPPQRVFESGSILFYLAEKFDAFLPKDPALRTETMSWLFWQMGATPILGGGFGHFYAYAPIKIEYAIDRYAMEVKRQLDLLDQRLADNQYIVGDEYTIADMAILPWYGAVVKNAVYNAAEFLEADSYTNLARWTNELNARETVQRGMMVNRPFGDKSKQLWERHDSSDFELRTQDILDPDAEDFEIKTSKDDD